MQYGRLSDILSTTMVHVDLVIVIYSTAVSGYPGTAVMIWRNVPNNIPIAV
eukprot:SAG11_NODE_28787_length_318_cov_0.456621_1_plen_51_part_00